MTRKKNVLLIGSGAVGTIAALNIEAGGRAAVTAVLRSNYPSVKRNGFTIQSCDHGLLPSWLPTKSKRTQQAYSANLILIRRSSY